jgi:hypothetical protein
MANNRFSRATVISVGNGRVVLKEQDGRHTIVYTKDDPDQISIVAIDEVIPAQQPALNPSAGNHIESL